MATRFRYGHVRIHWGEDRKKHFVHRISYGLQNGVLGPNDLVLHHCDNGRCVSATCLHIGDIQQNVAERELRNRRTPNLPTGTAHWSSKLSEDDVRTLRRARTLGHRAVDVAALWDISLATLYAAWRGDRYGEPGANIEMAS